MLTQAKGASEHQTIKLLACPMNRDNDDALVCSDEVISLQVWVGDASTGTATRSGWYESRPFVKMISTIAAMMMPGSFPGRSLRISRSLRT
jgi:hypothetical protein